MTARSVRYIRSKARPSDFGWAIIREALQAATADLPELYYDAHLGWVLTWD